MKLYIGFSRPDSFSLFASIIMAVESRKFDHVYVRIQEPMNNTWMVFQASDLAVNLMSAANFQQSFTTVKEYEIEISQDQYNQVWTFINQNLGTPYSFIEDVGILLMKIFNLKSQPFSQGMSAEFCSKLGANVCKLLGLPITLPSDQIDPSGLDSILAGLNLPCVDSPQSIS